MTLFGIRLVLVVLLVSSCLSGWAEASAREQININHDWKFKLGDYPGGEAVVFDDSAWSAINLPHSFDLPYFMRPTRSIGTRLSIKPKPPARPRCAQMFATRTLICGICA